MKNNELLRTIFVTYNHSPGTQRLYTYALEKYSTYHEMELNELLIEAESEENKGIKSKKMEIIKKIIEKNRKNSYFLTTTVTFLLIALKYLLPANLTVPL